MPVYEAIKQAEQQKQVKQGKQTMTHKKLSLIIALIVALAEVVIVYELWYSGTWLLASNVAWISWLKTGSFMLLFIGSLIAEVQELSRPTHRLLLVAVLLLGVYQFAVNVVVNYTDANLPTGASNFFAPLLQPSQVKFGFACIDAFVRTAVVVIMWMVTGLVFRGIAIQQEPAKQWQQKNDELQNTIIQLHAYCNELEQERKQYGLFSKLSIAAKAKLVVDDLPNQNGNGTEFERLAREELGTQAVSRAKGKS